MFSKDVIYQDYGYSPGVDPAELIIPYTVNQSNKVARIPNKGVLGVGPQAGNKHEVNNLDTMIIPGHRTYVEAGHQNPVGLLPRVENFTPLELWDAPYTINPAIEVV